MRADEDAAAAGCDALAQAAHRGWADLAAGRFVDVADDQLADFITTLGRRTASKELLISPVGTESSSPPSSASRPG